MMSFEKPYLNYCFKIKKENIFCIKFVRKIKKMNALRQFQAVEGMSATRSTDDETEYSCINCIWWNKKVCVELYQLRQTISGES